MPKWSLLPREKKFFILFQQGAENIVKMARELKDLLHIWENVKQRVNIIADLEQDGDAITHDVMTLLHRTFITPFDREDISLLAHSLDDIADGIHQIADTVFLYRVERPTEQAKELSDILFQAAIEVEKAITEISGPINQSQLLKRCVEINRLENSGDIIYRAALAGLFANPSDIAFVIKWRDIYEDLELSIDGCEVIANAVEAIAIKYA